MPVNYYAKSILSGTITMTILRPSHCPGGEVGGEDGMPMRLYKGLFYGRFVLLVHRICKISGFMYCIH